MTVPGPCGTYSAMPLAPFRGEPSPQVTEGWFHAQSLNMRFPIRRPGGSVPAGAFRRPTRGNAPALRPEMAALPRYRQQMCNIFTSFRASRTPLLTNNLFAYHKFCMRNTARPRRGQVTPPYRKWQGTSHFLSFAAKPKPAERCEHRPLQIICSVCHNRQNSTPAE